MNTEDYHEYRLDNGMSIFLQKTPTQTVSGRLRVWHGALNEHKGEEGLAHFLEHTLMGCGSQKYNPKTADEIRGKFGLFNAFTGYDRTLFPVDMLAEDTKSYIEYISDIVFNPRFEPSRLEEERQRVLRETADAKSNRGFKDTQTYAEAIYGRNSPHNYFILGNEEVVNSANANTLNAFHARGYHPNNMDLILAGALPEDIEELIEKNFGHYPHGIGNRIEFPRNPQLNGTTILHIPAPELYNHENAKQSSAQLSISFTAPTQDDEDSYSVKMLTNILGGDSTSRLFQAVSQRKGLAYGIGAQYDWTNNKGLIHIGGSIPSIRSNEAIDAVFEEMAKLQTDLVSRENLERLKKNSMYNIAKTFETNAGHVDAIELRIDKGITPEYHMKKMEEVTPQAIREAAIKYFPKSRIEGNYVLQLKDPLKE